MTERKILLFIISVIFYCFYNVHMWFTTTNVNEEKPLNPNVNINIEPKEKYIKPNNSQPNIVRPKVIPLLMKDTCSALEVFTQKPQVVKIKRKYKNMDFENNTIKVIGITVFLVVLILSALFDVLKVKEKERARRELNPGGERRQSLSEFANKKMLRRESSKFSLQLFQIAEAVETPNEEKKSVRESRPYTRAESMNSYIGEKNLTKSSAPASIGGTPAEHKLVKRESVTKLIGARPVPMVRRSSYPALPLNPDIQALMLNSRQSSFDSDDESAERKPRRVRILRRF